MWRNLLAGECGIDKITAFDATGYDCQIAAEVKNFDPSPAFPTPKELRRTDRFVQFGVHAGWQALLDSGLDLEKENRDEIGVFIGSGIGGLSTTGEQHQVLLNKGPGRVFAVHDPDAHPEHGLWHVLECTTNCAVLTSPPVPPAPPPHMRLVKPGAPSKWVQRT
jgi:3-oxoacyl-(acyl-carrier-protein) synthase